MGLVGLSKVGTVGMVENTCMCDNVFANYEPGWSPIRELVAMAVTYSQSRCMTDCSQRAAPHQATSHCCCRYFEIECFNIFSFYTHTNYIEIFIFF